LGTRFAKRQGSRNTAFLSRYPAPSLSVIHAPTVQADRPSVAARLPSNRTAPTFRGVTVPITDAERSSSPTILIAEDHEDSREALRTLLDAFGYRVETANNGREAVEAALAQQPDLILMDVMMPELDGFEATRRLREHTGFRQVPIVALTAMEGARERVMAAGCDDYVAKPIDVRSFLGRVEGWLREGRPAAR
jgi:CheY-like chemotaxis protein